MAKIIFFLLILFYAFSKSKGEMKHHFAASVMDLEVLLKAEKTLIGHMLKYAKELKKKTAIIKNVSYKMSIKNRKAMENAEKFLSNPLNSFSLIRRLHSEWNKWLKYLEKSITEDFNEVLEFMLNIQPTDNDLNEAAEGLQRLKLVYDLQTDDMAKGWLNGTHYNSKLNALDLKSIGMEIYKLGFRESSLTWLETGLRTKFDKKLYSEVFDINIEDLYDNYKSMALRLNQTFKTLTDIQSPTRAEKLKLDFDFDNEHNIESLNLRLGVAPYNNNYGNITTIFKAYKTACSDLLKTETTDNRLSCIYNDYGSPFLLIAPIKVEILNLKPFFALFYEVLTEKDINMLKQTGRTGLQRSRVLADKNAKYIQGNIRTSKTLMMNRQIPDFDMKLWIKRMGEIFDFRYNGVEAPQISNYGLGGHYGLHLDYFAHLNEFIEGDRYVSVVHYLSDVEQGGATVFPMLNITVFPKKGAALLWFNLENGIGDSATIHSSCPVIVGSKWVMSTWIHEYEVYSK